MTAGGAGAKLMCRARSPAPNLQPRPCAKGIHMNANDGVEFGVEVAHINGETVLAVRGDVDASTSAAFRAAVETFDGQAGRLVIDLSAVPFMDSSGLGVIAGTIVRQERTGGSLCIRNPRRQARQILDISGLGQLLKIDETEAHD